MPWTFSHETEKDDKESTVCHWTTWKDKERQIEVHRIDVHTCWREPQDANLDRDEDMNFMCYK